MHTILGLLIDYHDYLCKEPSHKGGHMGSCLPRYLSREEVTRARQRMPGLRASNMAIFKSASIHPYLPKQTTRQRPTAMWCPDGVSKILACPDDHSTQHYSEWPSDGL